MIQRRRGPSAGRRRSPELPTPEKVATQITNQAGSCAGVRSAGPTYARFRRTRS